ncbi:M24 family metallopeptidase [Pseudoxanthomonas winnipegensis]|jgi:Xaa-Pro aminopeptidase|uniref:Xaa-Pro aminopeptidase n=1 Tax=Pseudoxanthomonas winnipegensis TaxID=2480810 RepID=A0ABY1WDP6_9GAMM|nr:aminopeptidase P N-terminal domain-containing protein [Pseudoxanthomonas winnipegensis]TAA12184.1 M24 family metallopeptidase [Pseudoxanthomonas winnipegensis]TAA19450.1 M24 family metallopeptidase [Pseudoxanthomonas winnipegensis]TAH70283.1 M24 family metallopeptidase [Pseudoxanthomonas winnipegensis]
MRAATGIGAAEFARRRKALMRMAGEDAILVLPAAPERVRSHDTHYPYRQDSDFWYLTGYPEPGAVLVLIPGRRHGEVILFNRDRDPAREVYDGPRIGQQGAVDGYGMDDAYPIEDMDEILPGMLEGRSRVYYHFGRDTEFDLKLIGWVNQVRAQARGGAQPPHEFLELGHLLHEQRLFKSADELKLMQRAAEISIDAHLAAMRGAHAGVREYQLQAVIECVFRASDAWPAYGSIVGAGANACILHYVANNAQVRAGELVLIDAGAEYRNYAADITRTFPVDGRFSKPQRQLHDLVGAAQAAALAQARPGVPYEAGHEAAVEVLTEGLLQLGLLKGKLETCIAEGSYKRFYRHKTGHWLGLDVHDVGDYRLQGESRLLEPGMVFTIEPGLYISPDDTSVEAKWRGIGIRTEDNVAITADGHRVLTAALARSADEIEAVMASGG